MALRHGLQRALHCSTASRRVMIRSFSSFEHAADKLIVEIPREHDGLNIEFNWSLAEDDVTPHGDAYRNLKWDKLAEFAKDIKPAGKSVKVKEVDVDISFAEYEDAFVKTTDYLSHLDNIFAQDGAVGSYKDSRTRVRVITDSPAVALFAQSLLVRVPAKDPHDARPIVIYVATENEFKGQEPKASLLLDKNDEDELFVKVVITGDVDLRSVRDSIGLAKLKLMEQVESESMVISSDVLTKGDTSVLLFNSGDATRAVRLNAGQLYSAHLSIWNSVGLTSLFGGAIVDGATINKKTPRALVENGVSVYVPCHNLVNPPKAVLFMTGSGGVKPISTGDAAVLLKKVDENADTEKFSALLEKSATKAFKVGSDADVDAALAKL